MLEIKDLEVGFGGITALKGISLTVADGEIVTLVGANGAGKTTTLRTLSGLLKPRARAGLPCCTPAPESRRHRPTPARFRGA